MCDKKGSAAENEHEKEERLSNDSICVRIIIIEDSKFERRPWTEERGQSGSRAVSDGGKGNE